MLGWFRALMPKEERFFDLFARQSLVVLAAAEALQAMLQGGETLPYHCRQVIEREHEADEITREVLLAVRRTFITPFDRSDIKDLITSMDDAIDQMQKTAKAITLFEVGTFEPPMREMGDAIVHCAKLVVEAVSLLSSIGRHAERLGLITEEITRIEGQADDVHDTGLKELYRIYGNSSPTAFVVGIEIYDHLEKVVDSFDDVANEINSILIEHA